MNLLLGHAVLHSFKITDSLTCLTLCKFCTSARYSVMKACFRNLYITGNLMMISNDIHQCWQLQPFAAAIALITVAGPLAQSPPANTPGISRKSPPAVVTILPRSTGIPASAKCSSQYSDQLPQQGYHMEYTDLALPVAFTLARPPLISLIICGVTYIPLM